MGREKLYHFFMNGCNTGHNTELPSGPQEGILINIYQNMIYSWRGNMFFFISHLVSSPVDIFLQGWLRTFIIYYKNLV